MYRRYCEWTDRIHVGLLCKLFIFGNLFEKYGSHWFPRVHVSSNPVNYRAQAIWATQPQSERIVEWNLVYSRPLIFLNCVSPYSCNDFEVFQLSCSTPFAMKASILLGLLSIYFRNFIQNLHTQCQQFNYPFYKNFSSALKM